MGNYQCSEIRSDYKSVHDNEQYSSCVLRLVIISRHGINDVITNDTVITAQNKEHEKLSKCVKFIKMICSLATNGRLNYYTNVKDH